MILNHFAVHLKHCKSTILRFKERRKERIKTWVLRFQKLYLISLRCTWIFGLHFSASQRIQAKTIKFLENLDKMFKSSIFVTHDYTSRQFLNYSMEVVIHCHVCI